MQVELTMATQFEESYSIHHEHSSDHSNLSDDNDCRPSSKNIHRHYNESFSIPPTASSNTYDNITNNSNSTHTSHSNSIIIYDSLHSYNSDSHKHNPPYPRSTRSQTIQISPSHSSISCCGHCYRRFCFSKLGIQITIFLNLMMVFLNSALIIYELALVIRDESLMHTALPIWYIFSDIGVTFILFVEMLFTIGAVFACDLCKYLDSGWECWIDFAVLFLSIFCCIAYYIELSNKDIDNLTMLFVRICRDMIRIIRCIWFFKMLYSNFIRLEGMTQTQKSEYFAEPLLLKKEYKLQINESPKSTMSDQREYKGIKRVNVFNENDIKQMMIYKQQQQNGKGKKIYSQTPSPPNSKKTSPNNHNKKNEIMKRYKIRNQTRNCEDLYNGLLHADGDEGEGAIHRHTATKYMDVDVDSFNESPLTNEAYYDDLKLKQIKKKSVDAQRLKLLLQNLPDGGIIDESSSGDDINYQLHADDDVLTFI